MRCHIEVTLQVPKFWRLHCVILLPSPSLASPQVLIFNQFLVYMNLWQVWCKRGQALIGTYKKTSATWSRNVATQTKKCSQPTSTLCIAASHCTIVSRWYGTVFDVAGRIWWHWTSASCCECSQKGSYPNEVSPLARAQAQQESPTSCHNYLYNIALRTYHCQALDSMFASCNPWTYSIPPEVLSTYWLTMQTLPVISKSRGFFSKKGLPQSE